MQHCLPIQSTKVLGYGKLSQAAAAPGHQPVYVGAEPRRFVIPVAYLSHPLLRMLLEMAYEELGFKQRDGLAIPCEVCVFMEVVRATEAMHGGLDLESLAKKLVLVGSCGSDVYDVILWIAATAEVEVVGETLEVAAEEEEEVDGVISEAVVGATMEVGEEEEGAAVVRATLEVGAEEAVVGAILEVEAEEEEGAATTAVAGAEAVVGAAGEVMEAEAEAAVAVATTGEVMEVAAAAAAVAAVAMEDTEGSCFLSLAGVSRKCTVKCVGF
ncbi:hypothetical protein HPP92_011231 [Vanilla planifolia]|uniref:Small auxin up regulated protein n=1 Tax=Vanilla planifolia TaxID=51239 RepID=A0A835RC02_VANPL|nr:hypothetical protein HPP92_011231 [Vanilla planifolia]